MTEKLRNLRRTLDVATIVADSICIVLIFAGSSNVFLAVKVITAAIALIASAIKCGTEIASDKKFGGSIYSMSISAIYIVLSVNRMI